MTRIVRGERIGKSARLSVGCSAIIWDSARSKILLTRRMDDGQWCVPDRQHHRERIADVLTNQVAVFVP